MPSEPGDHQPREAPAAHVSQRLVVDHVVGGASPQKRQEVQPALRAGGGEPGKISVADVRAGAVHALVAGAGVIDRDPRRALEPALKHTGRLGQEVLLAGDEKTHDLALGDRHPEVAQLRDDPRYRHLARVILSEHEAPELGAEVADRQGPAGCPAYAAAKAGVMGFTKSLAKEVVGDGVLVNCVTPSAVRTQFLDQLSESHLQHVLDTNDGIPMGRLGEAEDVARLVVWLCTEDCSFSTGAVFDVSGGRATY